MMSDPLVHPAIYLAMIGTNAMTVAVFFNSGAVQDDVMAKDFFGPFADYMGAHPPQDMETGEVVAHLPTTAFMGHFIVTRN